MKLRDLAAFAAIAAITILVMYSAGWFSPAAQEYEDITTVTFHKGKAVRNFRTVRVNDWEISAWTTGIRGRVSHPIDVSFGLRDLAKSKRTPSGRAETVIRGKDDSAILRKASHRLTFSDFCEEPGEWTSTLGDALGTWGDDVPRFALKPGDYLIEAKVTLDDESEAVFKGLKWKAVIR
jgi:hypothetical protein